MSALVDLTPQPHPTFFSLLGTFFYLQWTPPPRLYPSEQSPQPPIHPRPPAAMSLQEAAVSRKEKLAMLKKRKELHETNPSASAAEDAGKLKADVFRFRNYDPETGSARKHGSYFWAGYWVAGGLD